MATYKRDSGNDCQSWSDAYREQEQEKRERKLEEQKENKIDDYLKNSPSASWAEANFKTGN
jgi:high-affinity Fe2+/Pb2+ permease